MTDATGADAPTRDYPSDVHVLQIDGREHLPSGPDAGVPDGGLPLGDDASMAEPLEDGGVSAEGGVAGDASDGGCDCAVGSGGGGDAASIGFALALLWLARARRRRLD